MGRGLSDRDVDGLRAIAPASVAIERARPDFRALLAGAQVSVSQAGYNTVVDLLRTGPFPILVPFEAGHETEQRLRAERLVALGVADLVTEADLSAERLAQAVRHGLERQGRMAPLPGLTEKLAGARRTVAIAEGLVRHHGAPSKTPSIGWGAVAEEGGAGPAAPALHDTLDWHPADEALRRARDRGYTPGFWWRDDDAVAHTPALDRLLSLAARHGVGIALASIPALIEPSLTEALADAAQVDVLVHGLTHANHAPPDAKKAEFAGHRPIDRLVADARLGLDLARARFPRGPAASATARGARLVPVIVPPWNRIAPELVARLADLGFSGVSTFRERARAEAAPGLVQVNTHLDPIDWHGSRGLGDPERIVANLALGIHARADGAADAGEPIGLLTHHRVHDGAVWTFCERLLEWTSRNRIQFMPAHELFAPGTDRSAGKMRYGLEDPRPEAEATES
ncbi:MAG: glycosyltransferase, partial [Microvirga sp.]